MRTSVLVSLIFLACTSVWAADDLKPFDVKLGLWETTTSVQTSGMAPVNIPPDALARMTPDQRAKVEAMMKNQGSPRTSTTKSCMTPEKMKRSEFYEQKQCTKTVVSSTGSKLEMRMHCTMEGGAKADGTVRVEKISSESTRGSVQMTSTSADHTMNMNSTFTSRWLGADCGDVK
jgi:Protein of unknown function (DUF3617)